MTYPRGSNHAGYYTFRDPTNHANLLYDGVITLYDEIGIVH